MRAVRQVLYEFGRGGNDVVQNIWSVADGARGNFMYMRADVTSMKLGRLAIELIAADAVTAVLLF